MKDFKNRLKLDNLSQIFSTEVLLSNNDKKIKNLIKRKKDKYKDMNSNKQINKRKKSSNNAILNTLFH